MLTSADIKPDTYPPNIIDQVPYPWIAMITLLSLVIINQSDNTCMFIFIFALSFYCLFTITSGYSTTSSSDILAQMEHKKNHMSYENANESERCGKAKDLFLNPSEYLHGDGGAAQLRRINVYYNVLQIFSHVRICVSCFTPI